MKKILAAMLLAGSLAACQGGKGNDNGASTVPDSVKAAKDSAKLRSDSMINAASDTLKAK